MRRSFGMAAMIALLCFCLGPSQAVAGLGDIDGDGIPDASDNCPGAANPLQEDCNSDGVGDACESDCNSNSIPDKCEFDTQIAKLTSPGAALNDGLGAAVVVSGDTMIVGAWLDDHAGGTDAGSAYVIVRNGGVWTQEAKLTASDAAANDAYGISVALSGDTAVVGAYADDHAGGTNAGSAYVFVRSGGVWTEQAKLTASDAAAGDIFGYSVALSGDTALVGARDDDDAGNGSGSAYVFVRSGAVWTSQAKLTASDAAASDFFGVSVALSGETAVVGAFRDDHPGATDAGSAYVFVRSGTVWTQQTKLTASDGSEPDSFGISVALSGDTAVIGAPVHSHSGEVEAGAAYVFSRAGGVWIEQAKLTASDREAEDWFGNSVALSGDTALVGEIFDNNEGGTAAGSAYVFVRSGGGWTEQSKLIASDGATEDVFGQSVSVSGDTAVAGATHVYFQNESEAAAGSVYVFSFADCDANGVPDVCQLAGNFDNSGDVDPPDIAPFVDAILNRARECRLLADLNGDGVADGLDIQLFVDALLAP